VELSVLQFLCQRDTAERFSYRQGSPMQREDVSKLIYWW
jgi:hypothetical protein